MFGQTFVSEARSARKPIGIAVSLITQLLLLGMLALAPLFLRPPTPTAQLHLLFLGPPPVSAPERPAARTNTTVPGGIVRIRSFRLIAPVAVPRGINTPPEGAPEAPDLAGVSGFNTGGESLLSGMSDTSNAVAPPIAKQPSEIKERVSPIAVGGKVAAANLIRRVEPAYPPLAKSARIEGNVVFQAVIGVDGQIRNLELQEGHPLLVGAARSALLQWRYRPTMLNGKPVEVVTTITVRFSLSQ